MTEAYMQNKHTNYCMNSERRAEMDKFIRIPLTEQMERDYKECAQMMDNGQEKDCEGCSMNGGSQFECMGEFTWCKDEMEE